MTAGSPAPAPVSGQAAAAPRTPKGMHDVLWPESARWEATVARFAELVESAGYGLTVTPVLEHAGVFLPRHRRGQRGGRQGDVRLRGPRRPDDGAAPRGHRPHRARLRPAPPRAALEGVVRGAVVPPREPPARPLPPAPPAGRRGARTVRPGPRRRGGVPGPRLLRRARVARRDAEAALHGRRRLQARATWRSWARSWPSGPTSCARRTGPATWRTRCGCSTARRPSAGPPPRTPPASSTTCAIACAAHFARVRAGLESLGVDYTIDHRLVRGFDYYTRTTFEFAAEALDAAQNGIGGGGRYDGLVELLGGEPTPGHRVRHRHRAGPAGLRRRGRVLDGRRRGRPAAARLRDRHSPVARRPSPSPPSCAGPGCGPSGPSADAP